MALERVEDLRREAERCLAQAQTTTDPKARAALLDMAARFLELANSVQADFDAILRTFTDVKMTTEAAAPAAQQQQQIQPKQDDQ